jgi:hypothetical protein
MGSNSSNGQLSLVVSVALQTAGVSHGLGHHYIALTEAQKASTAMFSIAAGFCSILATAWSKVAFALCLLRISTGRMRTVLWFIIISTNVVFGMNGLIQWIQCWPIAKPWHWELEGSCWSSKVVQDINTAVAGQYPCPGCDDLLTGREMLMCRSFFGNDGYHPRHTAVEDRVDRCY